MWLEDTLVTVCLCQAISQLLKSISSKRTWQAFICLC